MIDLEELTDEELAALHKKFSRMADKARNGQVPIAGAVEEELEERGLPPKPKGRAQKARQATP